MSIEGEVVLTVITVILWLYVTLLALATLKLEQKVHKLENIVAKLKEEK